VAGTYILQLYKRPVDMSLGKAAACICDGTIRANSEMDHSFDVECGSASVLSRCSKRRGRWRSMHIGVAPAKGMNSQYKELWSIFNENSITYLVVSVYGEILCTESDM
jgi:hypothetical protein